MALNYKQVSIPMIKGVDTKTDDKLGDAPTEVVNAFIERDGVLRKKFGDNELSKVSIVDHYGSEQNIDNGSNIESFYNDLLLSNNSGHFSYSEPENKWRKVSNIPTSSISINRSFFESKYGFFDKEPNNSERSLLMAENSDYRLISEQIDDDGSYNTAFRLFIVEKESGNIIFNSGRSFGTRLHDSEIIVPFSIGNELGVIYKEAGLSALNFLGFDGIVTGGGVTIGSISLSNFYNSVSICTDDNYLYVLYGEDSTSKYVVKKINPLGVVVDSMELDPIPADYLTRSSICINHNGDIETFVVLSSSSLKYSSLNSSLDTVLGSDTYASKDSLSLSKITCGSSDSETVLFVSYNKDVATSYIFEVVSSKYLTYALTDGVSIEYYIRGLEYSILNLCSSAFSSDNRVMCSINISYGKSLEIVRTYIIDKDFNFIATLSELNSRQGLSFPTFSEVKNINNYFNIIFNNNGELSVANFGLDKLVSRPTLFQDTLIIPNGSLIVYDGQFIFNPFFANEPSVFAENTSSGSTTGDFLYKAIYVIKDNTGKVYRSGTSAEFELTSNSHDVQISVSPCIFSSTSFYHNFRLSIEIYRASLADGLYRLIKDIPMFQGTGRVLGKVVVSTIDESEIDPTAQFLYTTGNEVAELENAVPPSFADLVWHNGRVFGISTRINEIRYSKKYVQGEGLAFSDELFLPVEDNQGRRSERAIGLASLDSRLIIFKPNSILVISGDGPDNAGQNNDFTEPELITTDVGCNNPKSIVLTGDGVFFQSKKGIYLLDRSLSVSYVGAGVEKFKDDEIVSALLMEERELLKFTTKEGRVLIYNHFYRQWTWYDDHSGAVSAANWRGDYVYIDNTGSVFLEDQTTHRKNGVFTKRTYDTGWLKLTGIQNYQRVRKLLISGKYIDDHKLKVSISYDYDDSTKEDYILSPQSGEDYQYSVHLRRQKSQSIRIKIEDIDTGATNEGFKITDLTIEAGVKKGLNKFTSTRSY